MLHFLGKQGDFMRSRSYGNAAETIMKLNVDIIDVNQLKLKKESGKVLLICLQNI